MVIPRDSWPSRTQRIAMRQASGPSECELRRIVWGVQLGSQDEFASGEYRGRAVEPIDTRRPGGSRCPVASSIRILLKTSWSGGHLED